MRDIRLHRLVYALAVTTLVAACGGAATTEPLTFSDIAGTYTLTSFDAKPLPTYLHETVIDPNVGVEMVVSGALTIHADGTADRVEVIEATQGQTTSRRTSTDTGTLTLSGNTFTLHAGTTYSGIVSAREIGMTGLSPDNHSRMYSRAGA